MAIYTKLGKKVLEDTIRIDGDCYVGDKVIKIRAQVERERVARLLYVTDLLADGGKKEIQDEIRALLTKR